MQPVSSGYADVKDIRLYHEIYGQGEPLVLIHGGLTTIGEMQGWMQPLAMTRQVIAVGDAGPRPHGGYHRTRTFRIVSGTSSAPTLGNNLVCERVAGAASCSEISHEDTTFDEIENVA